jgi:hypothetical protein
MNQQRPDTKSLVKLHTGLWWSFIIWFAMVTVLLVLKLDMAVTLSTIGLGLIYVGTVARLIQLGVMFRRFGRSRPFVLSCVLALLLIATVALRYLFQ